MDCTPLNTSLYTQCARQVCDWDEGQQGLRHAGKLGLAPALPLGASWATDRQRQRCRLLDLHLHGYTHNDGQNGTATDCVETDVPHALSFSVPAAVSRATTGPESPIRSQKHPNTVRSHRSFQNRSVHRCDTHKHMNTEVSGRSNQKLQHVYKRQIRRHHEPDTQWSSCRAQ